jgi:hypothetical protein
MDIRLGRIRVRVRGLGLKGYVIGYLPSSTIPPNAPNPLFGLSFTKTVGTSNTAWVGGADTNSHTSPPLEVTPTPVDLQ